MGPNIKIAALLLIWTAACFLGGYGIGFRRGASELNRADWERPDLANKANQFMHDHPALPPER